VAKYLQRSCPKCNGYLGIVVPERKAKMPVQAIQWTVPAMWLSACVGIDSRKDRADLTRGDSRFLGNYFSTIAFWNRDHF
jgi:hypothetical protein